jgi:outer membrane receptor protein involved in Fe transport
VPSTRVAIGLAVALLCLGAGARAQQQRSFDSDSGVTAVKPQEEEQPQSPPEEAVSTGKGQAELKEVVVEATRPLSAASSDEIRARDYEMRPHATTQEILNNVPGLVVAQHQGGGKATQYLIRGFDADHGTDFAVFVDDLPVNLVSHAHGQGYADLNFLIPETVDHLQLYKGPYFAQFGDFANAGALNIVTKDEVPESYGRAEGGSFDTQRYVAVASPKLSWVKSLLAAQAYFTNGPFVNPQHYARYNVFTKFTLTPTPESKINLSGSVYDGNWDGSGQIPLRVVSQGFYADPALPGGGRPFGRFDSIDPSEGGGSDRENLNLHYTYTPTDQDTWWVQMYASRYKLQLFSDFTFFKDSGLRFIGANGTVIDTCRGMAMCTAPINPTSSYIPGDGIEQNDQRQLYGARARYTRFWALGNVALQSQIGVETRNDEISLGLHRQVRRQRFFTVNELNVHESSVSGYIQHQIFLTDWIRIEAGLRGDVFFVDGENRLPAQGSDPNFEPQRIAGNTMASIVSPKANVIITPVASTDLYFNFGEGFHSNDARDALTAKANPAEAGDVSSLLVKSIGYEMGARTRQFDRLDAAAALWLLDLDSELVFSGDAGGQETGAGGNFQPSGPTRRWGVDFETRYRFTDWLFMDYDLTWADPRFKNGDAIPLAPTLLMNGGLTTEFSNGFSAALRVRFLDDRPAIEDRSLTARGYTLLDLIGKYRWHNVEASLALLNLTDTDWREAQFSDTTCVRGEVGSLSGCSARPGQQNDPNRVDPAPDIHFTPGNPFGVRGGLTVFF